MAELMRENADAAVLRLHLIVADPEVAISDLDAAELVEGGTSAANQVEEGEPAMAPDGVFALRATTSLLALASMDRLEVIDVAVRLVEVAVAVVVVAVFLVKLRQVRIDLCGSLSCRDLAVIPGCYFVLDEEPDGRADDITAGVGAIARLVVR